KNLGRKSVYELTTLLKKWDHVARIASNPIEFARSLGIQELSTPEKLQSIGVVIYPSPESAPAALPAERQSTLDQGRPKVDRGFISVAEVKIIDAVSLSQVSVRLLNGINQAQELNKLPVQTIGAYWVGHPETEKQFLNLSNLG